MVDLPRLHRAERNGIPVLWSPCPGPLSGGIVFRVGPTDEPVPLAGITHLIEHLAMTNAEDGPYDECNAFVDVAVTAFAARGEPADVAAFVNQIAATLSDPPLDQVEGARRVLRVEAAGQDHAASVPLLAARYGLRGFGAIGGRELGLAWLGAEQVAAHIARYFTAGNAVLWFSGPPPPELDPVLPEGSRWPAPPRPPLPLRLPACIRDGSVAGDNEAGAALGMLASWGRAITAGLDVLGRRAFKRLRNEMGASYHVEAGLGGDLDAGTVHGGITADALPDGVPRVRDALLAVVDELARAGPLPAELERSAHDHERRYASQPELDGWLCGRALDELLGRPLEEPAERVARLRALHPDEVAGAVERARTTAIMALPGYCPPPDGFALLETDGGEPVRGRVHRFAVPFTRRRLVAAEEGLTYSDGHGRATVRFDDCVAVLTWDDGARVLLGHDGATVLFSPQAFRGAARVAELIQRRVPRDRWVPMDELEPSPLSERP
jgi:predicted Zn-dependent peptidase